MRALRIAIATVIAASVGVAAPTGLVQAQQKFPNKAVRIVVGFSAGAPSDILARMIGPKLSEGWGQPVVVDNRTGGGGTLAAALVAKAAPDGYTLLYSPGSFVISTVLLPNLSYDPLNDFAGVTQLGFSAMALVVAPSLGVKSVKELIALTKAQPGKLIFGSAGAGGGSHLNGERFRLAAGIKVVHVGFKGQPEVLIQILGGRVHYAVAGFGPALPFIKDGWLLALAVLLPQRSPLLPELPTVAKAGVPGYEVDQWYGVITGAKVSPAIIRKLNAGITGALKSPDVVQRLTADGSTPVRSSPEEFGAHIKSEIAKWRKLLKDARLVLN